MYTVYYGKYDKLTQTYGFLPCERKCALKTLFLQNSLTPPVWYNTPLFAQYFAIWIRNIYAKKFLFFGLSCTERDFLYEF